MNSIDTFTFPGDEKVSFFLRNEHTQHPCLTYVELIVSFSVPIRDETTFTYFWIKPWKFIFEDEKNFPIDIKQLRIFVVILSIIYNLQ